jgi:hypothetical protein
MSIRNWVAKPEWDILYNTAFFNTWKLSFSMVLPKGSKFNQSYSRKLFCSLKKANLCFRHQMRQLMFWVHKYSSNRHTGSTRCQKCWNYFLSLENAC